MSALPENSIVSSILLRSGKGGTCRVFIVQTRNHAEVKQVEQLFTELETHGSVRALSSGVTTSFAVQSRGELPLLQEVESLLKEHFKFSVVYAGFNPVIHRIVEDLAMETGSRIFAIPICQSCGESDPFPTQVTLQGPGGKARARAALCDRCVAKMGGESEAEDFCRLLNHGHGDDRSDLVTTPATEVVRKRSLLRHGFSRRAGRKDTANPVETLADSRTVKGGQKENRSDAEESADEAAFEVIRLAS